MKNNRPEFRPESPDSGQESDHSTAEQTRERTVRYLAKRCGDRGDAEDIVQDAAITIIESDLCDDIRDVDIQFFFRVALNQYNNARRKNERRSRYTVAWEEKQLNLVAAEPMNDSVIATDVGQALNQLDSDKRRLLLDYMEGYTYRELAERYDVTLSCIRMRLHRAKISFAEEMEGYGSNGIDRPEPA